MCVNNIWFL